LRLGLIQTPRCEETRHAGESTKRGKSILAHQRGRQRRRRQLGGQRRRGWRWRGGGGGGGDTTPPAGTLEGKSKQDVDKLALTVGSNEQAGASGQASVSAGGAKKKPIASKTATADIAAGGTAKLTFKFSKKNLKKIKKLVKKAKKPKAKISVTVTDTAANKAMLHKTVKLKD
jgi:hypothetical protein